MSGLCMYEGLIDVRQVAAKLRRSVSYVWKKLRTDPDFPRPIWRRHKDTQWVEAIVDAYIESAREELIAKAGTEVMV